MIDFQLLKDAWAERHPGEEVPYELKTQFKTRLMTTVAPKNDPFILERIDELIMYYELKKLYAGLLELTPESVTRRLEACAEFMSNTIKERFANLDEMEAKRKFELEAAALENRIIISRANANDKAELISINNNTVQAIKEDNINLRRGIAADVANRINKPSWRLILASVIVCALVTVSIIAFQKIDRNDSFNAGYKYGRGEKLVEVYSTAAAAGYAEGYAKAKAEMEAKPGPAVKK
jgi:hypothetical protein